MIHREVKIYENIMVSTLRSDVAGAGEIARTEYNIDLSIAAEDYIPIINKEITEYFHLGWGRHAELACPTIWLVKIISFAFLSVLCERSKFTVSPNHVGHREFSAPKPDPVNNFV